MAKNSTGVYVVDKHNNPYELTEYNLFVQKECAKLQKKGIHIPGSGNTLVYIAELWQQKKAKDAAKAARDQKAREKAVRDAEKQMTEAKLRADAEKAAKVNADAKKATKKATSTHCGIVNTDSISIALREMGQPEFIQWETLEQREKRYNNLIMNRDAKKVAKVGADSNDTLSKALREIGQPAYMYGETITQKEKRLNDAKILFEANQAKTRADAEKVKKEEIEKERCYKIIQHSNSIISTFNVNNSTVFSNTPTAKRFIGVQV